MADPGVLVAVALGAVQGLLEWLPVSSEGHLALVLVVLGDADPRDAVRLALFLHAGTALAAVAYYRGSVAALLGELGSWRRDLTAGDGGVAAGGREGRDVDGHGAGRGRRRELGFYAAATPVSVAVAAVAYRALLDAATRLSGAGFVALVGVLLIATGLLQGRDGGSRTAPDGVDAVAVGALQGLAVLPGVSRSGVTVGALLLRDHEPAGALRLSFLLGVPASLGAGLLAVADGGVAVAPVPAAAALLASAVVGYVALRGLVGIAERVAFRGVCLALGAIAVAGGIVAAV